MRRRWLLIIAFAVLHYIALTGLTFAAMSAMYDWFDTGRVLTRSEQAVSRLADVLAFPAFPISMRIGMGRLGPIHALLQVLNSLLWGTGLYLLIAWALGWHRKDRAT